jgi:hypothetical protein
MAKLSFYTLLLAFTLAQVSLVTIPGVNALEPANLRPVAKRFDHIDMNKRMIKKRQVEVPANPAPQPSTSTDPDANTSTPTPSRSNTSPTPTTPTSTSTTPTQTQNTTSSTSTSTTVTTTSTTSSATSTTPQQVTSDTPRASTPTSRSNTRTGTLTVTASSTPTDTEDDSKDKSASFLSKSVIIGLIVAGSCVVAGAAIWTIIRKWKFSPSRHFEDRLEPINWAPTQPSGLPHDPTVGALARGNSQNGHRQSIESSVNGRNMSAANHDAVSMAPDFPPAHDFTAGPAGVGLGPGYVDMHRGPSPGPGAYGGQYETPNPYDAYDYNGYGQPPRRY